MRRGCATNYTERMVKTMIQTIASSAINADAHAVQTCEVKRNDERNSFEVEKWARIQVQM